LIDLIDKGVCCVSDSCAEVASKPRSLHTAKDSKSSLTESASSSSSAQSFAHGLPTASRGLVKGYTI